MEKFEFEHSAILCVPLGKRFRSVTSDTRFVRINDKHEIALRVYSLDGKRKRVQKENHFRSFQTKLFVKTSNRSKYWKVLTGTQLGSRRDTGKRPQYWLHIPFSDCYFWLGPAALVSLFLVTDHRAHNPFTTPCHYPPTFARWSRERGSTKTPWRDKTSITY